MKKKLRTFVKVEEKIDSHLKPGADYEYKDSGIVERVGGVPVWLQLVYVAVTGWGIYYLVRYWSLD